MKEENEGDKRQENQYRQVIGLEREIPNGSTTSHYVVTLVEQGGQDPQNKHKGRRKQM